MRTKLQAKRTFWLEVVTASIAFVWGACLLMPGPMGLPPVIQAAMWDSEAVQGSVALVVGLLQFAAIYSDQRRWRAVAAFPSIVWCGWLGGSIAVADPSLPSGYLYLLFGLLATETFRRGGIEDITLD